MAPFVGAASILNTIYYEWKFNFDRSIAEREILAQRSGRGKSGPIGLFGC
jgi:hypothetical protein